jgi:hypothetical protein
MSKLETLMSDHEKSKAEIQNLTNITNKLKSDISRVDKVSATCHKVEVESLKTKAEL